MEKSEKYLTFKIENELYAIPITKVREIIRYTTITPVHDALSFLKGVINLRGKIIPIIDMRLKFNLKESTYNDRTVFIIVDIVNRESGYIYSVGIAVDSVNDVVDISESNLERTPEIGLKLRSGYLTGIAQVNNNMIMILNIDKILTKEDVIDVNEIIKEKESIEK
ncbi:MAG TPA: chemotaxis protein CheW [Spirochaetota bacterium]|nr:chemotaxis protein CheW [Spirochaetota bacterium]HOM37644.1 chemotaxis protein CheW [Spirochaetota bacterium]HPQ49385.1 chemotaxis protein CheW [Spirochaetota bacterium]